MPRDGNEIGEGVSLNREMSANDPAIPNGSAPASPPIGSSETKVRKKRARPIPTTKSSAPASSPIPSNGGGDGQVLGDTQSLSAIAAVVAELVTLQRTRQFCIKQKNQSERQIEQFIASAMGYRLDAEEKDRKAVFARAKAFRLAVERGGEGPNDSDAQGSGALSAIVPIILSSFDSRKSWVDLRLKVEREMGRFAKRLPVYDFAKSIRGLGELGLACLTAEAGIPIGDYRTVSGLWSRMGMGVRDGRRQGGWCNTAKLVNDDGDPTLRYAPYRRAEVWAFCSDSMFRGQRAGDKDEDGNDPQKSGKPVAVPAHALGPYGEIYGKRRQHTASRIEAMSDLPSKITVAGKEIKNPDKWTKARCHNDAQRIMTKALLCDLWRVWRGMPPRGEYDG